MLEAHLRRFRDVHLLHPDSLQPTLRLTTTGDMSMFGVCVGSSDQADKVWSVCVGGVGWGVDVMWVLGKLVFSAWLSVTS